MFANVIRHCIRRWLTAWRPRNQEGLKGHTADNFVVVHCRRTADGRCDLGDCLDKLYAMGFKSVMVEVRTYCVESTMTSNVLSRRCDISRG